MIPNKIKTNAAIAVIAFISIVTAKAQTIDWSMKSNPLLNSINGVAFRADGQKVISGTNCHPASIRIFDVPTGAMTWDYTVGSNFMCVMGVAFSSNSKYISAVEEFGNLFIFDNSGVSPVIIDTINTGTDYGFSTAISPANDQVAAGCSNGKLKIYDITNGILIKEINAHPGWVTSVVYAPNNDYIITGGNDHKVKIWSKTGVLLFTCIGHSGDITNVKVTPDNKYVVSASRDDKIKIWNISTGILVLTISGHTDDVNGIDISPDGSKIVSASSDSTCKIWDFKSGKLLTTFGVKDSGAVNAVAWSPSGNKIITGNSRSDLVLWSIPSSLFVDAKLKSNQPKIFPNPTINFLNIELTDASEKSEFIICNALGQIQKSYITMGNYNETLDIHDLPNGFYYLVILGNNKKMVTNFNILR